MVARDLTETGAQELCVPNTIQLASGKELTNIAMFQDSKNKYSHTDRKSDL